MEPRECKAEVIMRSVYCGNCRSICRLWFYRHCDWLIGMACAHKQRQCRTSIDNEHLRFIDKCSAGGEFQCGVGFTESGQVGLMSSL